jgi:DNA modification methylase
MSWQDRGLPTETSHRIYFADSRALEFIPSESVRLVVTSPPYPMIEMWDDCFAAQNGDIRKAIDGFDGRTAFRLMHLELDKVWNQVHRILKHGGLACINVGDATRTSLLRARVRRSARDPVAENHQRAKQVHGFRHVAAGGLRDA